LVRAASEEQLAREVGKAAARRIRGFYEELAATGDPVVSS
jgi:hypothetical protein